MSGASIFLCVTFVRELASAHVNVETMFKCVNILLLCTICKVLKTFGFLKLSNIILIMRKHFFSKLARKYGMHLIIYS
jgi:hypothetical protein